jgi:hypothetical protein
MSKRPLPRATVLAKMKQGNNSFNNGHCQGKLVYVYSSPGTVESRLDFRAGTKMYGRDRGVVIVGTTGSIVLDGGGYEIFDLKGAKTSEQKAGKVFQSADLTGADNMTDNHFANFIAAIQKGEKLNQPIESGNVSVTMLQLSNIAWQVERELRLDQTTGHMLNDKEAMTLWSREYERGWAPHL